ncbi:hypothetical protein [Plebeiibacterium marinum]|uniref:Uncharacterized protein n=1 Tax=Plebeiibacterium marinum TaxID=2992111 RepID=A0AAE3MC65_9BACT|nr:hypothetical protein [Plebeiobacterium marinum]MCW3805033.1 hypothetical protein [Plebeiobacterium marinum]
MNLYKTLSFTYYLGMAGIILGVFLKLNDSSLALPFLIGGFIPFMGIRLFNLLNAKEDRRRLHAILTVSALFLAAAIVAIYFQRSYWIIGILLTATLDFYVSFRKYS